MYVVYKYRYSLYECKTNQTYRQNHKILIKILLENKENTQNQTFCTYKKNFENVLN